MNSSLKNDGELLDEFIITAEETPFEELIQRHGSMVFDTCRRIIGNASDAEDAVQAVFLTLAQKAKTLHDGTNYITRSFSQIRSFSPR